MAFYRGAILFCQGRFTEKFSEALNLHSDQLAPISPPLMKKAFLMVVPGVRTKRLYLTEHAGDTEKKYLVIFLKLCDLCERNILSNA